MQVGRPQIFWTLAKAVRLFFASLHSRPMCPQMCSNDIVVDVQPVGWTLKEGLFLHPLGLRRVRGSGIGPFDSLPICSYWLPIDIYGISYRFRVIYLAKKRSRPSLRPTRIRWQLPIFTKFGDDIGWENPRWENPKLTHGVTDASSAEITAMYMTNEQKQFGVNLSNIRNLF